MSFYLYPILLQSLFKIWFWLDSNVILDKLKDFSKEKKEYIFSKFSWLRLRLLVLYIIEIRIQKFLFSLERLVDYILENTYNIEEKLISDRRLIPRQTAQKQTKGPVKCLYEHSFGSDSGKTVNSETLTCWQGNNSYPASTFRGELSIIYL